MLQFSPKQIRGLEDALQELEALKERVAELEAQAQTFVTKEEMLQLTKLWGQTAQQLLNKPKT